MATAMDNSSLLLYRVGPVLCCAPSLPVNSIIPPPRLTRPPGTNASQPGIFRHGGHITSSIDLRYKFGVNEGDWADPCKVIVTEIDPGFVGFWVDQIMDVMDFPASGWGPLPAHLPRGIFSRTLILNKKIYLYAEFDQLYKIPNSGYLRVYIEKLLEEQQRHEKRTASASGLGSRLNASQSNTTEGNASLTKSAVTEPKAHTSAVASSSGNRTTKQSDQIQRDRRDNSTEYVSQSNVHKIQLAKNKTDPVNKNKTSTTKPLPSAGKNATSVSSNSIDQTRTITRLNDRQQKPVSKNTQATSDKDKTHASAITSSKQIKSIPDTQPISQSNKAGSKNQNWKQDSSLHDLRKEAVTKNGPTTPGTTKTLATKLDRSINTTPVAGTLSVSLKDTTGSSIKKEQLSYEENKTSGLIAGIFFLLVLVGLFSVLFWYITHDTDSPIDITSKQAHSINKPNEGNIVTESGSQVQNIEPIVEIPTTVTVTTTNKIENVSEQSIAEPANTETNETDIIITDDTDSVTQETTLPVDSNSTIDIPPATPDISTEANEPSDFKAEIQKDEQGITIVLDAPEDENVFKQDNPPDETSELTSNAVSEKDNTTIETSESSSVIVSAELSTQNQTVTAREISETKPQSRVISTEIVHIVVKGDTLWHIAIKYVNDPYKYPELAKLSNIKNPDLIYPGNRVRIIKRTKSRR